MGVTDSLVRVHRVDRQLRDLQSRLRASERFLNEQQKGLNEIDAKRSAIESQLRQSEAATAERESEAERIQARIDQLREQMNSAKTNREYKAFLTEVNTFKADKSRVDDEELELLTKVDELKAELAEMDEKRAERAKMHGIADTERGDRAKEIEGRVAELEAERAKLAADVPADVMGTYTALVQQLDDEAMAHIEELDRKRHEYNCGSCMMSIPVETVSTLLAGGDKICFCVSCGCILYMEPELAEDVHGVSAKR